MKIPEDIYSIAVVGLQKNSGKTETLNWLLRAACRAGKTAGITSVGIDGEIRDQVTLTAKPEIEVEDGVLFSTSEQHFRNKHFPAEILSISDEQTALGRLVTAKARGRGKVMLSGPSHSSWLKKILKELTGFGAEKIIVDGALSRLSPAAPGVTDALILATGAALSLNYGELIKKTVYTASLTQLPLTAEIFWRCTTDMNILGLTRNNSLSKFVSRTALSFAREDNSVLRECSAIFLPGSVTDGFLKILIQNKVYPEIIVRDFTRIFAGSETVCSYLAAGGRITVTEKPRLLAVTVNPWSPSGYILDAKRIIDGISAKLSIPVFNVRDETECVF